MFYVRQQIVLKGPGGNGSPQMNGWIGLQHTRCFLPTIPPGIVLFLVLVALYGGGADYSLNARKSRICQKGCKGRRELLLPKSRVEMLRSLQSLPGEDLPEYSSLRHG